MEKKDRKERSKHTACLGCRIRRRKCDNVKPICSGCTEINIPTELCLYHGARVGFKVNGSQKTLDKLREKNKTLVTEEEALRKLSKQPKVAPKSTTNNLGIYMLPTTTQKITNSKTQTSMRNPLMCTIREVSGTLIHYGPVSWFALTSTQEPLKKLTTWFVNVIRFEKDRYNRAKFEQKVEEDEMLKCVNNLLLTYSLGHSKIPDQNSLLNSILTTIASKLPTKAASEQLLALYFRLNRQRFLGFVILDEDFFYENFNKYITFDDEGKARLTVTLPDDHAGLSFVMLYLSMLIFMGFFTSRLYHSIYPQVNHIHMLEYLETLLLASEVLQNDTSFSISPHLDPEALLAVIHIVVFQRCTAHGSLSRGLVVGNDVLIVRQLIIYARILKLDQNLDVVYAHRSQEYRTSLKSMWTFLVYLDISEGLETGIPLKIRTEELRRYKSDEDLYVRALVMLNSVLTQFNEKVLAMEKLELIEWIRTNLTSKIDNFVKKEFMPAEDHVKYLKEFDFENIAASGDYIYHLQLTTIRILLYSTSASLYKFCAQIADQIVSHHVKEFEYLAIKRMAILVLFARDVFSAVQVLIGHPNSTYFSVVSSLLIISKQTTFALRRVAIHIGGSTLKNYDQSYSMQFLSTLINDSDRYAKTLLETLTLTSNYRSYSFSLDELEDLEVEKDMKELEKNYSKLLDYRFLAFENCRLLQQIVQSLENKKYNLNFLRLDYVFFYTITASNLFLALAFSSGDSINKKDNELKHLENTATEDYKKDSQIIHKQRNSSSSSSSGNYNEFDFNDFFERAIDTKSDKFDFKSFFTTSNDHYQQDDIEEFFENLSMPLSDYHSNGSQFF